MKAIITTQKLIRGFLARKNYKWRINRENKLRKIYNRIIKKENSYYFIQGHLDKSKIFLIQQ